jgi:hypothetical protein
MYVISLACQAVHKHLLRCGIVATVASIAISGVGRGRSGLVGRSGTWRDAVSPSVNGQRGILLERYEIPVRSTRERKRVTE